MVYGLQANDVLNVITFDSVTQPVMIAGVLKSGDHLVSMYVFLMILIK